MAGEKFYEKKTDKIQYIIIILAVTPLESFRVTWGGKGEISNLCFEKKSLKENFCWGAVICMGDFSLEDGSTLPQNTYKPSQDLGEPYRLTVPLYLKIPKVKNKSRKSIWINNFITYN